MYIMWRNTYRKMFYHAYWFLACRHGGCYWGYLTGTLSFSQVTATHLKIGYPGRWRISSTGTRSSNELQWLGQGLEGVRIRVLQMASRQHAHYIAVSKIRTICHARVLWKMARAWKQLRLLCPPNPWNLPGTALFSGYQSSRELWNPLNKTVLNKCS